MGKYFLVIIKVASVESISHWFMGLHFHPVRIARSTRKWPSKTFQSFTNFSLLFIFIFEPVKVSSWDWKSIFVWDGGKLTWFFFERCFHSRQSFASAFEPTIVDCCHSVDAFLGGNLNGWSEFSESLGMIHKFWVLEEFNDLNLPIDSPIAPSEDRWIFLKFGAKL